jgi:hypothetical protein
LKVFLHWKGMAMSKACLDRVLESIDANLPELHRERWALEAANLRERTDNATGAEKDEARRALLEHYKLQFRPETSRTPLIEEAKARAAPR